MYTNGMTVNDMLKECLEQVKKGNGDKLIVSASDDECNDFHHLWTGMCDGKELTDIIDDYQLSNCTSRKIEDFVALM